MSSGFISLCVVQRYRGWQLVFKSRLSFVLLFHLLNFAIQEAHEYCATLFVHAAIPYTSQSSVQLASVYYWRPEWMERVALPQAIQTMLPSSDRKRAVAVFPGQSPCLWPLQGRRLLAIRETHTTASTLRYLILPPSYSPKNPMRMPATSSPKPISSPTSDALLALIVLLTI